jgi:hypothetical protein
VLLYFLLGLAAVDLLVASQRRLWRAYDPDDYRDRLRNCRRHPYDLVLVGGSPVSEGVDPAPLAGLCWRGRPLKGAYNLGLPGATTLEVWHAVEHGLARPPRLLVYGITASDLNDNRLEPHGPRTLMDVGDVVCMAGSYPRAARWSFRHYVKGRLARPWNLFYFRNGIRLWAADRLERLWPGTCPQAAAEAREGLRYSTAMKREDGFAPQPRFQERRFDQLKAAGWDGMPFNFLDHYRVGGHLAYLHRLFDWAADHGVAVVLVDMPVSQDLEERLHPRAFACYRSALGEVAQRRGVPLLRASRPAVGLTDADFADLIHLNANGTARLSAWLRRQLASIGNP